MQGSGADAVMDHVRAADPLSAEWVTVVLLVVVTLMVLINVGSPRKWRLLGRSMFQMRLGRQALREEMDLQDRAFIGLLVVGATVLALFAWQALTLSGRGAAFTTLILAVGGIVVLHYVLLRSVGLLMRSTTGVEEYLYTGFLLFILAGVLLLPLVVFMAYRAPWRSWVLMAGLVLLGFMLLYRWFRGAWIGLGEGIPIRYIILYFCAAEILPVLLAVHHWRSTPPLFHP